MLQFLCLLYPLSIKSIWFWTDSNYAWYGNSRVQDLLYHCSQNVAIAIKMKRVWIGLAAELMQFSYMASDETIILRMDLENLVLQDPWIDFLNVEAIQLWKNNSWQREYIAWTRAMRKISVDKSALSKIPVYASLIFLLIIFDEKPMKNIRDCWCFHCLHYQIYDNWK